MEAGQINHKSNEHDRSDRREVAQFTELRAIGLPSLWEQSVVHQEPAIGSSLTSLATMGNRTWPPIGYVSMWEQRV